MQLSGVTPRAARELGLKPLLQLGAYHLMRISGWLRWQTPIFNWHEKPLEYWLHPGIPHSPPGYCDYRDNSSPRFFFHSTDFYPPEHQDIDGDSVASVISRAGRILKGKFPLFGDEEYDLGFPPSWNSFPAGGSSLSSASIDGGSHWTSYPIETFPIDVKMIWEPSRFGWGFILARAHLLTGDSKYAEGFWELINSWRQENVPNAGPQWISAQEVAIRVLALIFCFYALNEEYKTRPERIAVLAQVIAVHAYRIPATITYSRAQGNNHLLLEAVALYSVGLLFPEYRHAKYWRRYGRRLFIEGIREQVLPDGGYVQHSTNYQRFALEASLWMVRLSELHGDRLPGDIRRIVHRLARCLRALVDSRSGRTVNFGHNDGAKLFSLTECSFHDYRPTIQLAGTILEGKRIFPPGQWDEACSWFGLSMNETYPQAQSQHALREPRRDQTVPDSKDVLETSFPYAGIYLLRGEESWGMLRCANFTTRPAHSDQLHFDLWWRGENILRDAGTYLYNGHSPWRNGLASTLVHNAPVVDGLEPMFRAGKFLWLNWSKAEILCQERSSQEGIELISARHDGYHDRGISITRWVIRAGDHRWYLVDEIEGKGTHRLEIGWNLPEGEYEFDGNLVQLTTNSLSFKVEWVGANHAPLLIKAGEVVKGDEPPEYRSVMGWHSPTYARKDPAHFLLYRQSGRLPLRIVTRITLGRVDPDELEVQLSEPDGGEMSVRRVSFKDEFIEI